MTSGRGCFASMLLTFICDLDPVEDIAQKYPYLFSHPLRFWEQEQNEIRAMSAASEITDHIWVSGYFLYTHTYIWILTLPIGGSYTRCTFR